MQFLLPRSVLATLLLLPLALLPGCAWFLIGGASLGIGIAMQEEEETPPPPPVVTLTAPLGGETWGGTHAVEWETVSVEPVVAEIEVSDDSGATWSSLAADLPDAGTWDWDTSAETDGSLYRVRVRARDASGDVSPWSECPADLTLDNTAPVVALTAPDGGEIWGGVETVRWTTTDAHPFTADIEVSSDGGSTWSTVVGASADAGVYSWDTTARGSGASFRIRVRASDRAGHVSSWAASAADFELDNTAPAIALTSPSGGELWSGILSVGWTTTELNPSTVDFEYSDDSGSTWTPLALVADTSLFDWDTTAYVDNTTYRVRVRARDAAGNLSDWAETPSDSEVDNTPPSVILTSPAGGELWAGSRTVTWSSTDPNPSTVDLEVSDNGGTTWSPVASAAADTGSYGWDTTALADGFQYRIRLRAQDQGGNVSSWVPSPADFEIDNSASVTLTQPVGGEAWSGTRNVTWTNPDPNPSTADVELSSDSGTHWTPLATGIADTGTYSWNTSTHGSGDAYRVRVTVHDALGNTSSPSSSASDFTLLHYQWGKRLGGSLTDDGRKVAVDSSGNVIIAGTFEGTVDFRADWGGGTDVKAAAGSPDLFVTKVMADGSYGWTHRAGGTGTNYFTDLEVSASGDILVTGYFDSTTNFRADWGGTDTKTPVGSFDIFVLKILSDGSFGWVRRLGDTGYDSGPRVGTDASGNLYVSGAYRDTVNFQADFGGTDSKTSLGGTDGFLTRINADGSYGWTRVWGASPMDYGGKVAVDATGRVFVAGTFNGTIDFRADFGGGSDIKSTAGLADGYLLQVHTDGSYGWIRRFGGTGTDGLYDVALVGSTSLYLLGRFDWTADFRSDFPSGSDPKTPVGSTDVFLVKMQTDGTYGWSRTFGSASSELVGSVAVDGSGNAYVSGAYYGVIDFRADFGGSADTRTPVGSGDAFVARVNSDGSYGWARVAGGSQLDIGYGVAVDGSGNVYWGGRFQFTVDFEGDFGSGSDSKTSSGSSDIFLVKMR